MKKTELWKPLKNRAEHENLYNEGLKKPGKKEIQLTGRISYKYNEKLSFKTWYSHYKIDDAAGGLDEKKDRIRFEAKYSF